MNNKLLVSDMDGTLLSTDQTISQENLLAIEKFIEAGGKFTVATGRNVPSVKRYLGMLPINVPAILQNGALIYDFKKDETLYKELLPTCIRFELKKIVQLFPETGAEIFIEDAIYFAFENEFTQMHKEREGFHPISKNLNEIPDGWSKIVLPVNPKIIKKIMAYLEPISISFSFVQSEDQFLEILPKGVNKGRSLKILADHLGMDLEDTIAVGDNMNDYELLLSSGISFAVDNANPLIKRTAQHISSNNNKHAIADLLEKIYGFVNQAEKRRI